MSQSQAQSADHPTSPPPRVIATEAAAAFVDELRARHGALIFHQSGGCCDGSSPMCYAESDFLTGDADILIGEIAGAPFYISRAQFEYWKHTQLIIDVVPGQGGMFSLDNGTGRRFLVRSRLFNDDEAVALAQAEADGNGRAGGEGN